MDKEFENRLDRTLYIRSRSWLPRFRDLRELIKHESHKSNYFIHPGSNKIYHNLKKLHRWPDIEAGIATYVNKCLACSKMRDDYQKSSGLPVQPELPHWKWENIAMPFMTRLPKATSSYDTIWPRDGVATIKRQRHDIHGYGVRDSATTSGRDRLKVDLEPSTWRRRQVHFLGSCKTSCRSPLRPPQQVFGAAAWGIVSLSFLRVKCFVTHSRQPPWETRILSALLEITPKLHEGYRNTIKLPVGNNVVPLRSDTIQLVQN
ncbi:putative reverse transcriptase domain-containing protein [Tanacetum coccineum]